MTARNITIPDIDESIKSITDKYINTRKIPDNMDISKIDTEIKTSVDKDYAEILEILKKNNLGNHTKTGGMHNPVLNNPILPILVTIFAPVGLILFKALKYGSRFFWVTGETISTLIYDGVPCITNKDCRDQLFSKVESNNDPNVVREENNAGIDRINAIMDNLRYHDIPLPTDVITMIDRLNKNVREYNETPKQPKLLSTNARRVEEVKGIRENWYKNFKNFAQVLPPIIPYK